MELKAAFDFSPLTRCLAIVSHISQLQEPPSHRGGEDSNPSASPRYCRSVALFDFLRLGLGAKLSSLTVAAALAPVVIAFRYVAVAIRSGGPGRAGCLIPRQSRNMHR